MPPHIALDQTTYDALRKSPEIAALAGIEERQTLAGSRSWSGFYVYGRQTYTEFFAADTLADGTRKKDCGLGLFVEKAGGVDAVATRLRPVFGDKAEIYKQVRTIPTGDILAWGLKGGAPTLISPHGLSVNWNR